MTVERLDKSAIKAAYREVHASQEPEDEWHSHSTGVLGDYIAFELGRSGARARILNAGSGHFLYGISAPCINVDIVLQGVLGGRNGIVTDVECLGIEDNCMDLIICVGSVINCTDPQLSIEEFSRIAKPQGRLIVDFERINLVHKPARQSFFKDHVDSIALYRGHSYPMRLYSDGYIQSLVEKHGLKIIDVKFFHILPLCIWRAACRVLGRRVARVLDLLLSRSWLASWLSTNSIILCEKM